MMSELSREEQIEFLLDHYENPHHHGELSDADVSLEGGNPGCGDIVKMYLKLDGDRIKDISFTGQGCTISQASASIISDEVIGRPLAEIEDMDFSLIGDLIGEEMVKMRPRCATLGLETIKAALQEYRRQRLQGK
jgi:nitrogen fixation protein NifU and related proteins